MAQESETRDLERELSAAQTEIANLTAELAELRMILDQRFAGVSLTISDIGARQGRVEQGVAELRAQVESSCDPVGTK